MGACAFLLRGTTLIFQLHWTGEHYPAVSTSLFVSARRAVAARLARPAAPPRRVIAEPSFPQPCRLPRPRVSDLLYHRCSVSTAGDVPARQSSVGRRSLTLALASAMHAPSWTIPGAGAQPEVTGQGVTEPWRTDARGSRPNSPGYPCGGSFRDSARLIRPNFGVNDKVDRI